MHGRAKDLISQLHLRPHPEGGHFREVFRSSHKVQPLDERSARCALTTIYFLLAEGQHGRCAGTGSDPMRSGIFMKEIHWSSIGSMTRTWCIERCSGRVLQTLRRCASSRPGAGKHQGPSESTACWDVPSLQDLTLRISR